MKNELTTVDNQSLVELYSKNTIITDEDVAALAAAKEFITDTYLSVPMYRSLPVKIFGVLSNADFPTPESKFWQCKAEAEVHSKELVREMHDLDEMKLGIERSEFIYDRVMKPKYDLEEDDIKKKEVEFDMRKLSISISRQKFEMMQLLKKIKYRIEEIDEWRKISEQIATSFQLSNVNYANMLVESLRTRWNNELKTPNLPEPKRKEIEMKLKTLTDSLALKSNNTDANGSGVVHN
jgi:hypothetical protein